MNLQPLFEHKRLKIAESIAAGPQLVKEMRNMQGKVSPFGREQFGCWQEGEKDDLVLAVGLGAWWM